MKLVNPTGRSPSSKEDFKAYACTCNVTVLDNRGDVIATGGGPNCSHCNYSCEPGNIDNANANRLNAMSKNGVI